MNTSDLRSRMTPSLAMLALTMVASGALALPEYGTEVDDTCNTFNGTKPYTAYTSYGSSHCNLCHNADNRGVPHQPEWTWTKGGIDGQKNFCVVQGIIEIPAENLTIPQGGTIDLLARGFSPRGAAAPSTYTWSLSDGRTLVGPEHKGVVLSSPGALTITLNTKDVTDEADATPDQRTITVNNIPPVAHDERYSVQAGTRLNVPAPGVLLNDTGAGKLGVALVNNVTNGFLSLAANGGFQYTPNPSYVGDDSFTYTASNGPLKSDPATVSITVTPAPPVANADRFIIDPGKANNWPSPGVLANDTGSGALSAKLVGNTSRGKLILNADGSFKYTPKFGFKGTDQFSYFVTNGAERSAPVTVTLDVGPCRDNDNDGYSAEGGYCGPIDCKDSNARINPGAPERCGNGIDDDCNGLVDQDDPGCNGKDCIGQSVASQVQVSLASVDGKGKLIVKGSKAVKGATVTVADADTGAVLGTTKVKNSGNWKFVQSGVTQAPCVVSVEISGVSGRQAVAGAPAGCASPEGPECAAKP